MNRIIVTGGTVCANAVHANRTGTGSSEGIFGDSVFSHQFSFLLCSIGAKII